MDLSALTVLDIKNGLAEGLFSCRELVQASFDRIREQDGDIHAMLHLTEDEAFAAADAADDKLARGEDPGPLGGVPVVVKDNILIKGAKATAASGMLAEYVAAYDATVVRKLKKAGAVILGKTNMDEFAMGSSTENSAFGPTRNPRDKERIPGGSSGGSAAAVAAGYAPLALGSDTGGSIRQPAAMCGVVGLKPTYGRVSRYGLIAMASSFDQIGPMAGTTDDAARLLSVIEGQDPFDATSAPDERYAADKEEPSLRGVRLGVPKEYFQSGMDEEVEKTVRSALAKLEELGARLVEVSLPSTEYDLEVYYVLMPSEVSANLARFDGVRYGFSAAAPSLKETYLESRGRGFGPEVKRRIMLGTYALSAGYYDAYYLKAQKARTLIKRDFGLALAGVDGIVSPTSPTVAWKLGEKIEDPLAMYLTDLYTVSANVVGAPAVSVPCGLARGLPVGLQFIGRHFEDRRLLSFARAYERSGI